MATETFYADLPATPDFAAVADLSAYAPVPADWTVLLTDVVDSTKAIAAGRYKDVNLVGAACITAVLNALSDVSIPFVFGGDGAAVVVPPIGVEAAGGALTALAALAGAQFGLQLRVGAVPVSALHAKGASLAVRKLELSPGNHLALFSGGGLELAERLVKDPDPANPYSLAIPAAPPEPALEGLSCRWEPLLAANGVSLTLMLRATEPGDMAQEAALRSTLAVIQETLEGDPAGTSAPARPETLRFRFPPRNLWSEVRATAGGGSILMRAAKILVISAVFSIGKSLRLRVGPIHIPTYLSQLQTNTDFRKYDGLLRLVLDVTPAQADAIEAFLAGEHVAGRLVYGAHRAEAALMTCLVFSLAQNQHIHFIDGADGGFALAAQGFKKRLAALTPARQEGNG